MTILRNITSLIVSSKSLKVTVFIVQLLNLLFKIHGALTLEQPLSVGQNKTKLHFHLSALFPQLYTPFSSCALFLVLAGLSDRSYHHSPFFDVKHIQERVGQISVAVRSSKLSVSVELGLDYHCRNQKYLPCYLPNSCLLQ